MAIDRSDILAAAKRYIGVNYKSKYQGTGPEDGGFTCSGFTWRVFHDVGIDIPICQGIHSYYTDSYNGWDTQAGWTISNGHWTEDIDELQPGDLVFYSPVWDREQTGHVAIYYGNGQVIHANGQPVAITPIGWGGNFVGGGWPLVQLPEELDIDDSEMSPVNFTYEFNKFTSIRSEPRVADETYIDHYNAGESVHIDGLVVGDGYIWGHYKGLSSGKDRYVAIAEINRGNVK